jgi:hypothetical protein
MVGEITGRAGLRQVRFATGDKTVDGWWAEVKLPRARVDAAPEPDLTFRVEASLRDGLPALYMLASEGDIPKILPSLLPLEQMKLELEVERRCRFLDIRILHGRGGPVSAEGRLQLEPEEIRGAVLLRTSPIAVASLGLELKENSSHATPMVGSDWLAEHLAPLGEAAREKRAEGCPPQPTTCR